MIRIFNTNKNKEEVDNMAKNDGPITIDEMKEMREEIQRLKSKKGKKFKASLTLVTVVGVGAGLYGFKLGREVGINKGVGMGYMAAGQEIVEAWKEYTEEMKKSRGE